MTLQKDPLFEYVRYAEFKRLLDRVASEMDSNHLKTLAIISELPREGRTFFVSAFALGYSLLLNRRVLILNTVNQPTDRSLIQRTVFQSAAEAIAVDGVAPAALRRVDLVSPHSESDRKSEISSDFQLSEYVANLKDEWDLILFDTCAMSIRNKNNIDPIVIAGKVDATILLTSPRSLDREVLHRTRDQLEQWGVKPIGSIFNPGAQYE